MMRVRRGILSGFVLLAIGMDPGMAETINGASIMQRTRDQARLHKTQISSVEMVIRNRENDKRTRSFEATAKHIDTKNRTLLKFYRPGNLKGTGVLIHSDENDSAGDIDQWLYIPAISAVRKIEGSDRHKSFMGSDFTFADVAGRRLKDDRHELRKETDKYYLVSSYPIQKDDVYGKIDSVIEKKRFLLLRATYYDRNGNKIKTLTNDQFKNIKGMFIPLESVMKNDKNKGNTVLKRNELRVGVNVDDNDVGFRGLKSP